MTSKQINEFRASFGNAFTGFGSALKAERNLKIHSIVGTLVIIAGFVFRISPLEWCVILLTITMVVVSELLNTAVEITVDLVTPHMNEAARKAKDISASAVLAAALCSVIVGLIIFLPKVIPFMQDIFYK